MHMAKIEYPDSLYSHTYLEINSLSDLQTLFLLPDSGGREWECDFS